jgi:hypothetical protein
MKRLHFIHDVLWATGTHEWCRNDEAPKAGGGKRTVAAAAGSSSSAQQDELMTTFIFWGSSEGIDVLRFFCVLKTNTSSSVIKALRGGSSASRNKSRSKIKRGVRSAVAQPHMCPITAAVAKSH